MKHMAKGRFRAIGRVSLALALSLGLILAAFVATPALASSAPVWQNQQTNSGTSTSGSVAKPTNLAAGDLVILIVVTQNSPSSNSSGITPPANFTLIRFVQDTSSTRRPEVAAYWKIATAGEPASYNFTVSSTNGAWKAIAGRVTGEDTSNPIGNSSGNNTGSSAVTSLAIPGITTSTDNALLVGAVAARGYSSGPTNFVKPASMTALWAMNGTGTGSSGQPGTGGGQEVFATAGATGTRTFTWTNSARAAGLMFEILPVAAVTQITGQTNEVNCNTLAGVNVTLYQGASVIASTVSDGTGNYTLAVPALGDYNVTASKDGFKDETQAISVAAPTPYTTLDFVGDYGLIPNAPDLSYVLACINLWQFGTPPCQLGLSKMLAVINAWQFPLG